MIQSMTAYANKSIVIENDKNERVNLSLSLKSLNSRYFDITNKIPYIFSQFEIELVKLLKSKIIRGNIYLIVSMDNQNAFKTSIKPAISLISGYIDATNKIKEKLSITGNLTLYDILRLPDSFVFEDQGINDAIKEAFFQAVNQLADELITQRIKEGNEIKKDIEQRLEILKRNIDKISVLFETTHDEQKEKISKKITEMVNISNELADTNKQMLYLTLDKMDIHEEISRFNAHIANIRNLIDSKTPEKGKQIDFISQELFREINTITAKTPNSQIIELAISNKVEIEKIREQAQNIL